MWTDEFAQILERSTTEKPRIDEALTLKDKNLPEKIYKYRSDTEYSRHNLSTDTVWMGSPESYNDPYDSWLTLPSDTLLTLLEASVVDKFVAATKLQGVVSAQQIDDAKRAPEPLKAILQHVKASKSPAAFDFWSGRADVYSAQLFDYAKGAVLQIQGFRKREKVCSFSAVNDSLLMWSHYGDNHKGFCIEYDLKALSTEHFFRKNLYPILYRKEFYNLNQFMKSLTGSDRGDFRPMMPLLAMLHKFDGWEYEREWRLMHETQNPVADHNRPAPVPSKLFLGARLDPSKSTELLAICRHRAIPTFQMNLAEDRFVLLAREFLGKN